MQDFQTLGLPGLLVDSLKEMKFVTPTPVQAQTIPTALEGKDILGSAQTGTGKTAAYGIPLVAYLLNNPSATAIILTPTRELAMQVLQAMHQLLGKKGHIQTALLIGGDPMFKQLKQLKGKPRLFVGTPGRINDHLTRGSLKLDKVGFFVLDETDRMLDMGFAIQLQTIFKVVPVKRQTLMFSATLAPSIVKMASNYLQKDAVRVSIGSTTNPRDTIKQEIVRTNEAQKHNVLVEQLGKLQGACIVFVKTKMGAERVARKLRETGHLAEAMHGDLSQRHRERVIRGFRDKKNNILVATDIAARGLDISHIDLVINYDLPQCPEDYIHRIGRTGRASSEGTAISLITSQDNLKWKNICKLMNPEAEKTAKNHTSDRRPAGFSKRARPPSPFYKKRRNQSFS
jgi:ATP-dependent RNA helicase DeaD